MTWHPDDPYDAKALRRGEVVEMLRSAVAAAPSARDWARDNAVSETAVSQILRGESPRLSLSSASWVWAADTSRLPTPAALRP